MRVSPGTDVNPVDEPAIDRLEVAAPVSLLARFDTTAPACLPARLSSGSELMVAAPCVL